MLSILIPVYNFDVRDLVKALHQQGIRSKMPFEVLIFDDASTQDFRAINAEINQLEGVEYIQLETNAGRSAIRNMLANAAKYNYCLFMDGDSKVISPNYIINYLEHIHPAKVIYGGRSYDQTTPSNAEHILHWTYGLQREQQFASIRSDAPYDSFMTNNFLIPKNIMLEILFDESITQYGHEDTLFGMALKAKRVPIVHIENPLDHIGLETDQTFLRKAKIAIENLYQLKIDGKHINTKLLSTFEKLDKLGLVNIYINFYGLFEKRILKNLSSEKPNMKLLDLFKLSFLSKLAKKKNTNLE